MMLSLVWSRAPVLHPIRWLSEAGDESIEPSEPAALPAMFVNVPVAHDDLIDAVEEALLSAGVNGVYEHVQSAASTTWTVNHNLGRSPASVRVLSVGGVEISCDVIEISPNQLAVNLVTAQTGRVIVI
jgi:hypothetical protein